MQPVVLYDLVMRDMLENAIQDLNRAIATLPAMAGELERLGEAMLNCWEKRCKVMVAGNGGSSADAMHLAEELSVRFMKNRRALAAIALCDPTAITCAGNDFGFDHVFSRQVEALGNPGDILILFSTSGNSSNILRAIQQAKLQRVITVGFFGKDGGKAKGQCDLEFVVPVQLTARVQEAHKILYHTLCEWIDQRTT
jgi:D-sedoheptulose 7-phosphate isomerase